ncbi:MAG: class I SAM-dependent RNA methyltransferase [Candidatus Puniceispirillaceae bacterium]
MARQRHRRSGKKRAIKSNQRAGRLPRNAAPIEVNIDYIGGRGDGVGKALYTHNYNESEHDVFVPASLPGERLLVQPLSLTAQGIKAQIIEIISPSPERHKPRCDVFPACGGCRFQHWDETAIREWKKSLLVTFLMQSNVPIGDMRPFYSSPQKSRRRASFHLKCLADGAIVGFREYMGQHIIALHGCVVLHPALLDLQTKLQQFASANFPAGFAANAHANLLDKHSSYSDDSNICLYLDPISGAKPFSSDLLIKLGDWAASIKLARLSINDQGRPMVLFAPEQAVVGFGKITVSPPPGAFMQATRDGEAVLQASIAEIAGTDRHFVDLFAGCGTLSLPLLDQAARLLAVEQSEGALAALRAGADAAGLGGRVSVKVRNLFDAPLVARELGGFDMAILDPPRRGAAAQCQMLAKADIAKIAMISCNPASFARDASILINAGFKLNWVQVIDQFLFSNHLEIVGAFHR